MKTKQHYIVPNTEIIPIGTECGIMDLVIGIHSTEEGIEVGAKENDFFDFDDSDPWNDNAWSDTPTMNPWEE